MNKTTQSQHIADIIERIVDWATTEQNIDALALVGSYAHGTANSQSDVDLQFLTQHQQTYFKCTAWIEQFGDIASLKIEDWSAVKTLRVSYRADFTVNLNLTSLNSAGQAYR